MSKKTVSKTAGEQLTQVASELVAIKRLLICALQRSGAPQSEIAKALGVTQSAVSRMMAKPPRSG